jgi:DNA helicase-2/ATP-dependent DNA helicase PcrA
MDKLNEFQKQAINQIKGPVLVIAGAGSGKTKVIVCKILKLIEMKIPPENILAVTFTNKAANEMSKRVRNITNANVLTTTFHSLGSKILRESIHHLGYSNNFNIYDEEDSLKLIKECYKTLNLTAEKKNIKKVKYLISNAKNDLIDLEDIKFDANFSKHEINIFHLYQKKLKEYNALDFDDLLYLTAILFKKHLDVLEMYQDRWPFLLIDEYQDTNFSQYTIAKLLSNKTKNIFVVGDPDQSIYSFRGARYQNILNFEKDYKNAKVIKLTINYRSTKNILDTANFLIKNNSNRLEKDLISNLDEGEKIKIFKADSDRDEAKFVIQKILRYKKNNIELDNIAIFYRTNFQSRIFEDHLINANLPYVIFGGISFYHRKEIKDILAFLKLVISDSDFISFSRTINIPKRGIGQQSLSKLSFFSEKENISIIDLIKRYLDGDFNDLKLSSRQKSSLKDYLNKLDEIKKLYLEKQDISEIILKTIDAMQYFSYLKEDPLSFETRKENVQELVSIASIWQKENEGYLEEFLNKLSLLGSTDLENEKCIKLMSLHNSKGLEFDLVFMVGLEEDLFPHINSKDTQDKIEEERRLCYVGITRAKKHLYISHSSTRYIFGGMKYCIKSRFLKELPDNLIKKISFDPYQIEENSSDNNRSEELREINMYYPGLLVEHKTFGKGMVSKVYSTSLGETLDIIFDDDDITRSIVTKYAKLSIV